jgi:hypothetical protein
MGNSDNNPEIYTIIMNMLSWTSKINCILKVCFFTLRRSPIPLLFLLAGVFSHSQAGSYNGFTYTNSGTNITITDYTGSDGIVAIPSIISGVGTVTSIGECAFQRNLITNITIPNSITNIGNCAFITCTKLTNVTIPNSVHFHRRQRVLSLCSPDQCDHRQMRH